MHFRHPEVFRQLGIQLPSGFLLHGPPGCGKSLLAHAIAGVSPIDYKCNVYNSDIQEMGWPLLRLAATELVSGVSGETEEKMRDLFQKAKVSTLSENIIIIFVNKGACSLCSLS